jgi:hypothetical protein
LHCFPGVFSPTVERDREKIRASFVNKSRFDDLRRCAEISTIAPHLPNLETSPVKGLLEKLSTVMQKQFLLICLLLIADSLAFARVGETSAEIENRYGKPLPKDHSIFANPQAASLPELPRDEGIGLWIEYNRAVVALTKSPVRAVAQSMLGDDDKGLKTETVASATATLSKYETIAKFLEPRVYLMNDTLIQVMLIHRNDAEFSLSESYFTAQKIDPSRSKPAKKSSKTNHKNESPPLDMGSWVRLGGFSYKVTEANVSKVVAGASAIENEITGGVIESANKEIEKALGPASALSLPAKRRRDF